MDFSKRGLKMMISERSDERPESDDWPVNKGDSLKCETVSCFSDEKLLRDADKCVKTRVNFQGYLFAFRHFQSAAGRKPIFALIAQSY